MDHVGISMKTAHSAHLIIKLLGTEGELHIPVVARNFLSMHLKGNKMCQLYFVLMGFTIHGEKSQPYELHFRSAF